MKWILRYLLLWEREAKVIQGQSPVINAAIGTGHGLFPKREKKPKSNPKYQIFQPATFSEILVLGLFLSSSALAHPEYKFGGDFPQLLNTPRSTITVIYNAGTIDKPSFKMAMPAIVPVSHDGKILWFDDEAWRLAPFAPTDRLVIEKDMLGADTRAKYSFPGCLPQGGEKFSTPQGVGWLVSCGPDITKVIDKKSRRVTYDPQGNQILSRFYNYKFKKENHMLFESVTLKGDRDVVVSKDSHLYIRSDVKNFFTLDFSSDDIESDMKKKRVEPLAAFASLGFYLKVLFFKITLDLSTDVGFFESSANIPMMMTLPVNAYDRLHKKSGVLYNFRLGDGIDPKLIKVKMPTLNAKSIDHDFEKIGLEYCKILCSFELEVPNTVKPLHMRINISRSLVERGMFPWFVDSVEKHKEDMEWDMKDYKDRVGLYFEVSKLPKGSHPWDFWLTF